MIATLGRREWLGIVYGASAAIIWGGQLAMSRAGATSGLFGAANFALGAVASAIAAALHDNSAIPVSLVMCISLGLAALSYFGLARSPQGHSA